MKPWLQFSALQTKYKNPTILNLDSLHLLLAHLILPRNLIRKPVCGLLTTASCCLLCTVTLEGAVRSRSGWGFHPRKGLSRTRPFPASLVAGGPAGKMGYPGVHRRGVCLRPSEVLPFVCVCLHICGYTCVDVHVHTCRCMGRP